MRDDKIESLKLILKNKNCDGIQCAFCPFDPIDCGMGMMDHANISRADGTKKLYENALNRKNYMDRYK